MYGTIARLKVKPGASDELRQLAEKSMLNPPPGLTIEYLYQMDSDPTELWLVVMFESKEAYHDNAQRAETHAAFEEWVQLLSEAPEWHDGQIIYTGQPVQTE